MDKLLPIWFLIQMVFEIFVIILLLLVIFQSNFYPNMLCLKYILNVTVSYYILVFLNNKSPLEIIGKVLHFTFPKLNL